MEYELLAFLWYLIIGVAIIMYAILDGFDLGVGALHLLGRKDEDRRIFLNSIGPVWDGNEVWLVIVIGALFAGFPMIYAIVLSGFYSLLIIFIGVIMIRASAIEFRSKREGKIWRFFWDFCFSISSIVIAFILGLSLGNFMVGLPLDKMGEFTGDFGVFFRPYPILTAFLALSLFMMHGSIYLVMKTEGDLQESLRHWSNRCIIFFMSMYLITTGITWVYFPEIVAPFKKHWFLALFSVIVPVFIISIPILLRKKFDGFAFISSCFSIIFLFLLFGIGHFPYMLRSTINPEKHSITYLESAASEPTLKVLLLIVVIGIPLVLAYGIWVYRIFRGKVRLDETSY